MNEMDKNLAMDVALEMLRDPDTTECEINYTLDLCVERLVGIIKTPSKITNAGILNLAGYILSKYSGCLLDFTDHKSEHQWNLYSDDTPLQEGMIELGDAFNSCLHTLCQDNHFDGGWGLKNAVIGLTHYHECQKIRPAYARQALRDRENQNSREWAEMMDNWIETRDIRLIMVKLGELFIKYLQPHLPNSLYMPMGVTAMIGTLLALSPLALSAVIRCSVIKMYQWTKSRLPW